MKPIRAYKTEMFKTREGECPMLDWLKGLDAKVRATVLARIGRIEQGNLGDCKAIGGVFELRIHLGAGYRVYFGFDGDTLVILLSGGSKRTQDKDIKKAVKFFEEYKGSK